MTPDIVIEDDRWQGMEPLATRALAAVSAHMALPDEAELCLMACDDARIAELNGEFRDKARATNVLSWPSEERVPDTPGAVPAAPTPDMMGDLELGDIAIAYETCAREAREQGKPFEDHVTHLIVHGTLHLLGYDHETEADAVLMERIEVEILGKLGISDPYRGN